MTPALPIPPELWDQVPPAAQAALLTFFQQQRRRIADLEQRVRDLEDRPELHQLLQAPVLGPARR